VLFPRTQAALKLELQERFRASRAALEAYFSAVEDAAQPPKKTSRGCTSAREFRVILLCPCPNGCYAVPSSRSVVKRCAYDQVPTTKRREPDPSARRS
jgi:hypothetical protein